jgi:hypothetical protein
MSESRCPHCQTVLPEAATFCAACGNRLEGWSKVPVAEKPASLPGGQEPTTNMQPTPSLLRAAALSKTKKEEPVTDGDSAMMRAVARPLWARWPVWLVVGLLAAGGTYYVATRKNDQPLPPVSAVPPPVEPSPVAVAPPPAPTGPVKKKVRRAAPVQVSTNHPPPKKPSKDATGLPHKTVATDSKAKADPSATRAALEDAPHATRPMTEAEMKKEAEAEIDGESVRFVVESKLSQVHACYKRAFKETSPGGRVEIGFAITPQGTATRVRTEANTTGSDSLANCLEGRVKSWQFPKPVGGDNELIYPFVFAPGS